MPYSDASLSRDIERIKQIPIVPTILDVVCQMTGMGFAAIARVTQDRWIACSVRDDIQFGLVSGGELKLKTTICYEIRGSHQPVIIDHVAESEDYCNHHTPNLYGFQSYISFPIFLKNGDFFGTLCAIDPQPAQLNNSRTIGMFNAFTDLIAFHYQQIELIERSQMAVQTLNQQLTDSMDETRQYRHISNHNLQEPLRKIRLFSGLLIEATEMNDVDKAKTIASKINSSAQRLSMMVKDLSGFSELENEDADFERVDLTKVITDVVTQLSPKLKARKGTVNAGKLPSIPGIPLQLEQLFYHLISNALKFSKKDVAPVITISANELAQPPADHPVLTGHNAGFVEIQLEDNGIGIEASQLEKIFDIFSQVPSTKQNNVLVGEGIGLAYCRRIIRNHAGSIKAHSEFGKGTTFSILLPVSRTISGAVADTHSSV